MTHQDTYIHEYIYMHTNPSPYKYKRGSLLVTLARERDLP